MADFEILELKDFEISKRIHHSLEFI